MSIKVFSHISMVWHNIFGTPKGNLCLKFLASLAAFLLCTWVFVKWNSIKEFEDFIEIENLTPSDSVRVLGEIRLNYDYSFILHEEHVSNPFNKPSGNSFAFKEIRRTNQPADSLESNKLVLRAALGDWYDYVSEIHPVVDSLKTLYYVRFLRYCDLKSGVYEANAYHSKDSIEESKNVEWIQKSPWTDVVTIQHHTDSIWNYGDLTHIQLAYSGVKAGTFSLFPDSVKREITANGYQTRIFNTDNFVYKEGGSQYEYFIIDPIESPFDPSIEPQTFGSYRPHILSMYDISQAYFAIYVRSASIDTLHLNVNFNGAVNLYPIRPDASEMAQNGIVYDNRLSREITSDYLFYGKFPEMEGMQQVRTFLLGAILTLFLTLLTKYGWSILLLLFKFVKNKGHERSVYLLMKEDDTHGNARINIIILAIFAFFICALLNIPWATNTALANIIVVPLVAIFSCILGVGSTLPALFIEYVYIKFKKKFFQSNNLLVIELLAIQLPFIIMFLMWFMNWY